MDRQSFMIGVDRLFLAEIIEDNESGISYGTPFAAPGVTEIGVALNNTNVSIPADDLAYETANQQGDIDITVSLAGLSGEKRADVEGGNYNSNTGVVEYDGTGIQKKYALGYRRQKADKTYRYKWFTKGSFTRPDSTAQTKGSSVTPQPAQYTYRALNRAYDNKLERTLDSSDPNIPTGVNDSILNDSTIGWFSNPDYVPTASGTPISNLAASSGSSEGQIDLTFTAPTNAVSIKPQVNTIGGWVDATIVSQVAGAITIGGLTTGNSYQVRLIVNGGTNNGISNTATGDAG